MTNIEKLFEEFKERIVEVECACDDEKRQKCVMYPEYCDGTHKEFVDLVQLMDEGLNNRLLADKDTHIEELERENLKLAEKVKYLEESEKIDHMARQELCKRLYEKDNRITEAKELIRNIIRVTWGEGWNYDLEWKVKAEQFIKK